MLREKINITRRELLSILVSGGVGAYAGFSLKNLFKKEDDSAFLSIDLLSMAESSVASYEVFQTLSKLVTARSELDEITTRKMYKVFINEQWGKEHIISSYHQILSLLNSQHNNMHVDCFLHSRLGEAEQWFITHLLVTWYLGVYYHESHETVRISYDNALMFLSINDDYPLPFKESVGYAQWTRPLR